MTRVDLRQVVGRSAAVFGRKKRLKRKMAVLRNQRYAHEVDRSRVARRIRRRDRIRPQAIVGDDGRRAGSQRFGRWHAVSMATDANGHYQVLRRREFWACPETTTVLGASTTHARSRPDRGPA